MRLNKVATIGNLLVILIALGVIGFAIALCAY